MAELGTHVLATYISVQVFTSPSEVRYRDLHGMQVPLHALVLSAGTWDARGYAKERSTKKRYLQIEHRSLRCVHGAIK